MNAVSCSLFFFSSANFFVNHRYYRTIRKQKVLMLRSYEIVFRALFECGHYFVEYGFIYMGLHFLPILLGN